MIFLHLSCFISGWTSILQTAFSCLDMQSLNFFIVHHIQHFSLLLSSACTHTCPNTLTLWHVSTAIPSTELGLSFSSTQDLECDGVGRAPLLLAPHIVRWHTIFVRLAQYSIPQSTTIKNRGRRRWLGGLHHSNLIGFEFLSTGL